MSNSSAIANTIPLRVPEPHHNPFRTEHPAFDAILCDIDGCLTPEHHRPFDTARLLGVRAHNERAIERRDAPVVTLCTGRPVGFAEAICRAIGNTVLPICAENGVWLWHPAENTFHRDPNITQDHIAAVHAAQSWIEADLTRRGVTTQPGKTCSISLYHPDPEELPEIADAVRARFEVEGWPFRVSSTWRWINCDLDFVSKATAIERLIEHAGLDRRRLAGVGDTDSARFIRERVAWFACPANAQDGIKSEADYISPLEQTEGVLDILERLPRHALDPRSPIPSP